MIVISWNCKQLVDMEPRTPILGQYNLMLIFFTYYFADPQTTLGHYQEDSLTNLMLITCVCVKFRPEDTDSLVARLSA